MAFQTGTDPEIGRNMIRHMEGFDDLIVVCRESGYSSPISADEIFYNGQIRPIYPIFYNDQIRPRLDPSTRHDDDAIRCTTMRFAARPSRPSKHSWSRGRKWARRETLRTDMTTMRFGSGRFAARPPTKMVGIGTELVICYNLH
jgi:hypothetical protein